VAYVVRCYCQDGLLCSEQVKQGTVSSQSQRSLVIKVLSEVRTYVSHAPQFVESAGTCTRIVLLSEYHQVLPLSHCFSLMVGGRDQEGG